MTKQLLCQLILFLTPAFLFGQQEGRMETDRPDQTESPFIVKKGWMQAEIGFNLERENGFSTLVHPTVLWKYGIAKKFELRLITEAVTVETPLRIPDGNEILTGVLPLQLGGKLSLWEEKGLLPKVSLIFHVAPSKLGSRKFHTEKWAPNFRFTMQHTLSENIGLGYNIGAEWDGFSNKPSWIYTIAPGFNLGKKWYGYIEAFGSFTNGDHAIDGGMAYYASDHIKIDISSGTGLSNSAIDWYGAIGVSFRFKTKKK